jgi:predicted nucleic acid-binding Zn ribbon protein
MSKGRKREPLADDDLRLLVAGIAILLVLMMVVIYKFDL